MRVEALLRSSPQAVKAVWLKRNPLGQDAGHAAADLIDAAPALRTLDLVQSGLTAAGLAVLVDAFLAALGTDRLGPAGAEALAPLIAAGGVAELYVSAAGLEDAGALALTAALTAAPRGKLRRLSLASNGFGPQAAAELVAAAARADVELVDLGRVRAASALAAADNHIDEGAASAIGAALAGGGHNLTHLVLTDTGMRSREAHRLLDHAQHAVSPTRFVLGKGIATSVRRRLDAFSASVALPVVPGDVAAVRSVYRTQ